MARKTQLRQRIGVLSAVVALLATPAAAAEGSLQIFPDARILYLLVLFVLLIAPVQKLLFAPLLKVLEDRRDRIDGAKGRAEQVAKEADAALARYDGAVRAAKEEAEVERRSQVESARGEQVEATTAVRSEAEQQLARARDEVQQSLAEARAGLRAHAEEVAREAASRVLGRPLS